MCDSDMCLCACESRTRVPRVCSTASTLTPLRLRAAQEWLRGTHVQTGPAFVIDAEKTDLKPDPRVPMDFGFWCARTHADFGLHAIRRAGGRTLVRG